MNARNLGLLSAAALAIIVVAIWIGHSRSPNVVEENSLYPDLKGKLDSVNGISIYKAGDQLSVEIARDGVAWKVKQRGGFPADASKVKTLLINIENAKLREQKTSNPANYAALSVQDLSDAATSGQRIELAGAPTPVKLIVGKHDSAAHSTYVRRAGEGQSWLINTELETPIDPVQWLRRDVINIGADRIQQAETQLTGSPSYASFKNARADANFDVKTLPKGRELSSVAAPNVVAQALTSIQLDDVRPAIELNNEKNAGHTVFRTFDGLVVDSTGYSIGDKRWVVFHVAFDGELAKKFHVAATSANDKADVSKKDTEPKGTVDASLETAIKKGQEEVDSLNSNLQSWAFAIPTYKYDALFKPLDDLLKKPEMIKKPDAAKPPSMLEKK